MKSKQVQEFKETEIGKIPPDWEVDKLENHLIIKGRIGWKNLKTSEYTDVGPFIVGGLQIRENKVVWEECAHVTEDRYNESPEIMLHESDILMTKDGTIGKLAYIENTTHKATVASHIHVIRKNSDKVFPRFLFYVFKSPRFQNLIEGKITGSVVPALTQKDINNTLFPIPSIKEQQSIAKIFNDLDSKIENLQNQNKVLEQIAQAIFKSWFVDFDGVTEFEDSELGKIPKGWKVGNLENICEITMGQSPPGTSYNEDGIGIIFFQGKTDFGNFFPTPRIYCISPKRFAEKNDILFTVRAPVGAINIAKERCCIGRGLASLRLKEDHGSFLYYFLKSSLLGWQKFESEGTVYGAVKKDDVYNFQIIIPPFKKIINFNQTVNPVYYTIWKNNEQIQSLTKTRDLLLPKLMSGEIRV